VAELVYIGLGSNLEEPKQQIKNAVVELKSLPHSQYVKDSGLYLSKPMVEEGVQAEDQPDYYNAVVLIETDLAPTELLDHLQAIENRQGRVRDQHWGPRTIDLDVLLYGQQQINNERLQVPHSGMCEREFVLYPLQRLNAEINIPGHGMLKQTIKKCPENGMKYVGEIE
jgi:2-amino-4-hydroxy-6-hydroxymethyldihydropteridine diphosphokinase